MAYLNKRGVPPSLWADLNLRFDSGRKMVCFPFYNKAGKLAGMRGRSIIVTGGHSHHDYSWNNNNNSKLVLMNENNIDWMQPVVVVEGEFDLVQCVAGLLERGGEPDGDTLRAETENAGTGGLHCRASSTTTRRDASRRTRCSRDSVSPIMQ